jgi:hypothetical protein
MAKTIDITNEVTPLFQRAGQAVDSGALNNAMGRGATNLIQAHLFKLDGTRANKLGGTRTHFFSSAAKATQYQARPGEILISINQVGFRQRLEGGTIRTVRAKYLAIPVRSESYGKSPREFNDLVVVFGRGRRAVGLAQASRSLVSFGRRRKDGSRSVTNRGETGGLLMFVFKKEVTQAADPSVLPGEQQIAAAAVAAGEEYLKNLEAKPS